MTDPSTNLHAIEGRLISVWPTEAGSAVTADTFAGVTAIAVEDAGDFNESGGNLILPDGTVAAYTSVDMDTDTITLASATTADLVEGDYILVSPAQTNYHGDVEVLGFDDPLVAVIPYYLYPWVKLGDRDAADQETVLLAYNGYEWFILDIPNKVPVLSDEHADNSRIFEYRFECDPSDAGDGYKGIKLKGYSGTIQSVTVTLETTAPTGDEVYDILLNGVSFVTVTIPGGSMTASEDVADVAFVAGDRFRVEFTDTDPDSEGPIVVDIAVTLASD